MAESSPLALVEDNSGDKSGVAFYNFNNEFYSCYGEHAKMVANDVIGSQSMIKQCKNSDLSYITMGVTQFETVVKDLLLTRKLGVIVYGTTVKATASQPGNTWKVEKRCSPANLTDFEHLLDESFSNDSNTVLSVVITQSGAAKNVGVAVVYPSDFKFKLSEFTDNEFFADLENLIVRASPAEFLLSTTVTSDELAEVFRKCDVTPKLIRKSRSSQNDLAGELNRLLKFAKGQAPNAAALPQMEQKLACDALWSAIDHLGLVEKEENRSRFKLSTLTLDGYMRLDLSTLMGLNVLPTPGTHQKEHSLFGLLNNCRSAQGEALLLKWLRQPLTDKEQIEERHCIVETLLENASMLDEFHQDLLRKFPSLGRLATKLARKTASLEDCYKLYQAVRRLPSVLEKLEIVSTDSGSEDVFEQKFGQSFRSVFSDFTKFVEMIDSTLDFSLVDKQQFYVKPEFDENLQVLRDQLNNLEENCRKEFERMGKNLGLDCGKSLKLDSSEQAGYSFRVTKKDEKLLRNNRAFEILSSKTGGVQFVNAGLKSINEEYLAAKRDYVETQKNIVKEIVEIGSTFLEPLFRLTETLAELDVLVSLAVAAMKAPVPYTRPKMLPLGSDRTDLKQLRHPLVEAQESRSFIPNDILLSRADGKAFHMITGPNMGGKSTYIRSVALATLMAQIGSFVPTAADSTITICDSIAARVGAADCLLKGVSTFMAEMTETASIVRSATDRSLVIIDELGRGTSTYDGFGLAWAIAKHIAESIKCFCMFATHFHELNTLANDIPAVYNEHVTAMTENGQFTLLYEVRPGPIDRSFGIHIAEMVQLPDAVVKMASNMAEELEGGAVDATTVREFLAKVQGFVLQNEDVSDDDLKSYLKEELGKIGVDPKDPNA